MHRYVDRINLVAGIDESGAASRARKQLERAAPDDQSLGFVGTLWRLVDDADGDSIARQLDCHDQSDRTGPCDKNIFVHMFTQLVVALIVRYHHSGRFKYMGQ